MVLIVFVLAFIVVLAKRPLVAHTIITIVVVLALV